MTPVTPCLICKSNDVAHFLDARDYITGKMFELRKCARCGFVFTWPEPADFSEHYPSFYRQYHPLILWLFRVVQELRVSGWINQYGHSGSALEVGCGHGWMLNALKRRGWDVTGIERSAESARFATHKLGLRVFVGGLESLKGDPRFDLIVLHEVLEHLANPMETLHACAALLKTGGSLMLEVPNLNSWQFRFAGRHWEHLNVPRHMGHFTPDSLRYALGQANLQVANISYVSLEYDPFGWLQSTLNRLGFPQNLLLRWLAGGWRGDPTRGQPAVWSATGLAMVVSIVLLVIPSFVVAVISWAARRGAIMEVRAVRPRS